jgi:hypothetical protein
MAYKVMYSVVHGTWLLYMVVYNPTRLHMQATHVNK